MHMRYKEVDTKNIGLFRTPWGLTSLKHIDCGIFYDLKDYFSKHFTLQVLKMIKRIASYNLTEASTEIFTRFV